MKKDGTSVIDIYSAKGQGTLVRQTSDIQASAATWQNYKLYPLKSIMSSLSPSCFDAVSRPVD